MATRHEYLTVTQVCEELGGESPIARSTWDDWRAKGRAPRCVRLPNGQLRIRRIDLERWLDTLEDAA